MATFPTWTVDIALGANPGDEYLIFDDPIRGLFNTGKMAPADTWVDVSADLAEIHTSTGRQRLLEQYGTGQAQAVLNNEHQNYTPWNLSGTYVAAGVTQLQPERRMRVRETLNGVTTAVWQGYVNSYKVFLGRTGRSMCVVSASGPKKVLARFNPLAASSPVGSGETAGVRIGRLCDLPGIPDSDRDFDTSGPTLQATTMAQNTLSECELAADSVLAAFYESADGKLVLDDLHALYEQARSNTAQATFGDNSGELNYSGLDVPEFDDALVKNDISAAAVGGTAQTVSDETSIARYWDRTHQRHDLILEDDEDDVLGWAQTVLKASKDAEQRIDAIEFDWPMPDAVSVQRVTRKIRDRVRAIRRIDAGDDLDRQLYIEGISHDVDLAKLTWRTKFRTSSATPFDGVLIFDSATLGKFNTNTFAAW